MDKRLTDVFDKIKGNKCPSREDIELILQNEKESVPFLVPILKEASKWKYVPEVRTDAPMHAIFLLGALESEKGIAPLTKMLTKDEEFIDLFFGYIVMQCLPWALARIARNKPRVLYKIAKRDSHDTYVRDAAAIAMSQQCFLYPEKRKKIVKYFRKLLSKAEADSDPDWIGLLVNDIADIAPVELRDEITELFDKGLVPSNLITDEDMEDAYREPNYYSLNLDYDIFRIYEDNAWLFGWNDPEAGGRYRDEFDEIDDGKLDSYTTQPIRKEPKIGRNEPCPCGSGKKYKKCSMCNKDFDSRTAKMFDCKEAENKTINICPECYKNLSCTFCRRKVEAKPFKLYICLDCGSIVITCKDCIKREAKAKGYHESSERK